MNAPKPQLPRPPIFMLIFISMFGFIGLAVLIFLWAQPFNQFDSPPLFFRIFGSFIAIAFMAVGFGLPIGALKARRLINDSAPQDGEEAPPAKGYKCPNCGAGLGNQEVSPSGDVKCTYCHKWWNIHTPTH